MEMVFQLVEAANELVGNLQTTSETAEDTLAQPDADNGNSQEDSGPSMLGIEEPEGFDHGPLIAAVSWIASSKQPAPGSLQNPFQL